MRRVSLALLAFVLVLAAVAAFAQAPQVEKNVSMALSMAIMQGALDQCTKDGYKVSVVIVDRGGNVAASVRGDGTPPSGSSVTAMATGFGISGGVLKMALTRPFASGFMSPALIGTGPAGPATSTQS